MRATINEQIGIESIACIQCQLVLPCKSSPQIFLRFPPVTQIIRHTKVDAHVRTCKEVDLLAPTFPRSWRGRYLGPKRTKGRLVQVLWSRTSRYWLRYSYNSRVAWRHFCGGIFLNFLDALLEAAASAYSPLTSNPLSVHSTWPFCREPSQLEVYVTTI